MFGPHLESKLGIQNGVGFYLMKRVSTLRSRCYTYWTCIVFGACWDLALHAVPPSPSLSLTLSLSLPLSLSLSLSLSPPFLYVPSFSIPPPSFISPSLKGCQRGAFHSYIFMYWRAFCCSPF